MHPGDDPDLVESLVSAGRFEPYLKATGGDRQQAVRMYQWNASITAACFECFHYVEVIVRNAIDREMRVYLREDFRSIPWFLLPISGAKTGNSNDVIEKVRTRLRSQGPARETRDQILAGLDFGFWTTLLHTEYEELWRHSLRKAFPNSSGKRKDVVAALESLRIFRNRLAHHDSLLAVDIPFRLSQMMDVLNWVDPRASQWLASIERVSILQAARPVVRKDTVVVAAKAAWPLYQHTGAYICQAGRSFQPVDHLAFYADREIKAEVPAILRRVDNVEWTAAEVNRLTRSSDEQDRRLAQIISSSLAHGWTEGRYQVFELTRPGEHRHVMLPSTIPHLAQGRGSAFTQGQRYVARNSLMTARSTADIQ